MLNTTLRLALAARDAYFSAGNIGNDQCNALIRHQPGSVEIAFQGSNDGRDWWSNFDFRLVPHGPGRVSNGFLKSYLTVEKHLLMESIPDDDQIALVTGHSRGSPHACLHALKLVQMGLPVILVTFASPRWCDKAFATHFDRAMGYAATRIVFESDLVTRLPPNILGHYHTDNLRWFDGSRWRTSMPLHTRIGVYLFNRKWPLIGNNVSDHSIDEYITALQRNPL